MGQWKDPAQEGECFPQALKLSVINGSQALCKCSQIVYLSSQQVKYLPL